MTVEFIVLLTLIALWTVPPVLIVLVMRFGSISEGIDETLKLTRKFIDSIYWHGQRNIIEPIRLTYDEEAKAERHEMIELDKLRFEIAVLQEQLDLAELKANEFRLRLKDPGRLRSEKPTKKERRFSKSSTKKSKKNKKAEEPPEPKTQPAETNSILELQNNLSEEEQKIAELTLKISDLQHDLQLRSDLLDSAAALKSSQISLKSYEDMLQKDGCVDEVVRIREAEITINEKIERMKVLIEVQNEMRLAELKPASNPERFRELVELEKQKILEKRAKLPSKEELAKFESFGTKVNRFFSLHRKINDLLVRVDPDSGRVFERMRVQLEQAMKAHEVSKQNEIKLKNHLLETSGKVDELSEKILSSSVPNMTITSTRTTLEASVIDLEASLSSVRRKNKANEMRLFEIGLVIERLYIIRAMLAILPVSLREFFDLFIQLVNASRALLVDESLGKGMIEHVEDRLAKLENDTMMVFIKMAKGESKNLQGRELVKFKERLSIAAASLTLERQELQSHKERWETELQTCEEEPSEFRSYALYRRDCYATVIKSIDQGLDVISILSMDRSTNAQSITQEKSVADQAANL